MKEFLKPNRFKVYLTLIAIFSGLIGFALTSAPNEEFYLLSNFLLSFLYPILVMNELPFPGQCFGSNVTCTIFELVVGVFFTYLIACIYDKLPRKKLFVVGTLALLFAFSSIQYVHHANELNQLRNSVTLPVLP